MTAATLAAGVDVTAVEEHLARYAVSCSRDGAEDAVEVVLVVCKRCGYLMPLAAERVSTLGP